MSVHAIWLAMVVSGLTGVIAWFVLYMSTYGSISENSILSKFAIRFLSVLVAIAAIIFVFCLLITIAISIFGHVEYGKPIKVAETFMLESFEKEDGRYYLEQQDDIFSYCYYAKNMTLSSEANIEDISVRYSNEASSVTVTITTTPSIKKMWFFYELLNDEVSLDYSFTIPSREWIYYSYEH